MTMKAKQKNTLIAGGAALVLALVIPTAGLPSWGNLAVGVAAAICGGVALFGALTWDRNNDD